MEGILLFLLKVSLLHESFSSFVNSKNGAKSRKESHIVSFNEHST